MKTIKLSITVLTLFVGVSVGAKEKTPTIINKEITVDASVEKAWDLLGPQFADAYKWASSISHSESLNKESLNGSSCTQRGCAVKGMGDIKEVLKSYSPEDHSLTYIVNEGMPKMVKYASNNWVLTDLGDGKTKLSMKIEMKLGGMMGSMMRGMMSKKMSKMSGEIAEEFKYYVEKGIPHPRTVKATK